MVVNDVFQVAYFGTLFSQRIMSVFHYRVVSTTSVLDTEEELAILASEFKDDGNPFAPIGHLLGMQASQVTQDYVRVQKVLPTRSIYWADTIAQPGIRAGTANTANIAASLTKRTITSGRKGVGRVQIGGIPAADVVAGIVSTAVRALMDGLGNVLDDNQTVLAGDMEVRCCLPTWSATEQYDVLQCIAQDTARTMHRRTLRLGE